MEGGRIKNADLGTPTLDVLNQSLWAEPGNLHFHEPEQLCFTVMDVVPH